MNKLNIIYFGSPSFAATILESLINSPIANTQIVGVVTNPDKQLGRKQILTPSPVAQIAQKYHLPTFKPTKLDPSNLAHLKLLKPDVFLVAAFGKILPLDWLNTPTISTLNIHFSLLPLYRGALCVQEAIKNQDKYTGVTLMKMDQELDHGPIISQANQEISQNDNVHSLTNKLTTKAITLLQEDLFRYLNQDLKPTPQDHSLTTTTPSYRNLTHDSSYVPYQQLEQAQQGIDAPKTHALIRSLSPQPGAWTMVETQDKTVELKIIETNLNDKYLQIATVQLPGKKPITWKQFVSGHSFS